MSEMESSQQPEDPNILPLSQERLICKAASLSYFLTNEVAVAPVSPILVCSIAFFFAPKKIKLLLIGQV